MDIIDKVAWLYILDRKVLFARTKDNPLFYTVGGKRKFGESDVQVLIREVEEETGVTLDALSFSHIHTFIGPADRHPGQEVRLKCFVAVGDKLPEPRGEIEELAWFGLDDGDRTTIPGRSVLNWLYVAKLID